MARKITAAALAAAVFLAGCVFYTSDPARARDDANTFLSVLFMQKDFEKAYELTTAAFKKANDMEYMRGMLDTTTKKFGVIEGFRAEAYVVESKEKMIILFYKGLSEKAMAYARVTMEGDGRKGYKVTGIDFSDAPYGGYRTIREFR